MSGPIDRLGDEIHRVKESQCLACKKKLDGAGQIIRPDEPAVSPSPGDILVCLHCGHIMAYADDLTPRELTDEEMLDVAGDPAIVAFNTIRAPALAAFDAMTKKNP